MELDGNPWFIAKDVASHIGYRQAGDAVRILFPDEKGTHQVRTPGGPQFMSIISESGLYKMIMRSDKKEAREFQDWVTRVVLPAIRVVELDGNPWFVAKDVCKALGIRNATEMVRPLDPQDKAKKFLGFGSEANVISEAGLYQVTLRAQRTNPIAKDFQDWVTRVVLPAIRKDGAYIKDEENIGKGTEEDDEAIILRAMKIMERKIEKLKE